MRNVVTLAILLEAMLTGIASAAEAFDVKDAHAFDAKVLFLDRTGFRYVMTDYHTGKPVRQRQYIGQARFFAMTVFDFQTTSRHWAPGRARAIAVGDIVKVYGIEHVGSRTITVYRLEDRGGR